MGYHKKEYEKRLNEEFKRAKKNPKDFNSTKKKNRKVEYEEDYEEENCIFDQRHEYDDET